MTRERILLFELAGTRNINDQTANMIGQRLAELPEVELCHKPKIKPAVALQIKTKLTDEQITAIFRKLSRKSARIVHIEGLSKERQGRDK